MSFTVDNIKAGLSSMAARGILEEEKCTQLKKKMAFSKFIKMAILRDLLIHVKKRKNI